MSRKKRVKEPLIVSWLAYVAIRCVFALYGLIPARKAYGIGSAFVTFFYPLFRGRRKVAVDNILRAGITDDPKEADRIARRAFGHFAGHLCEALKVGQVVTAENWRDHLRFDGPEETRTLLLERPDLPVMILTGHHGVWEAGGIVLSYSRPLIAVARKMNNPFLERYFKTHHFRGSITVISKKKGFTPDIIRQWKQSCAAMTLVMDQHANKKQGIVVDFLGRPASTHTSPARLHLATGIPMLIGSFVRDAPFQYRILTDTPYVFRPTGNRNADTEAVLKEVNRRLGEVIRKYPEQYLWAHKRWRVE
ncbi:MAG: lysophospholipid acyltransferase family protein [Kiritimatiellae bacterium]|nr:lysophospholipid acyltransferase family protein [Kiritimatiellia bacterium]